MDVLLIHAHEETLFAVDRMILAFPLFLGDKGYDLTAERYG
jgi:hypothetical protein